jgi:hypothetical protein
MASANRTMPGTRFDRGSGITIEGLQACMARLQELPEKVRKRILRKSIEAGGAPLVREARKLAPKDSGLLGKSLDKKTIVYAGGKVVVSIIGQRKRFSVSSLRRRGRGGISRTGQVVPIHLVTEPTRPHRIPKLYRAVRVKTSKEYRDAQRRLGLRSGGQRRLEKSPPLVMRLPSGKQVIVESIDHPGTKGDNFLKAAYETHQSLIGERFAAKMSAELDKEILALRTKTQ